MAHTVDSITQAVFRTLGSYQVERPADDVLKSTLQDLGLDSLDHVEFFLFLEEDLGVQLPDPDLDGPLSSDSKFTVSQVINHLATLLQAA